MVYQSFSLILASSRIACSHEASVLLQSMAKYNLTTSQGTNSNKIEPCEHFGSLASFSLDELRDELTGIAHQSPEVVPSIHDDDALIRVAFDRDHRDRGSRWCDGCYTMAGTFRLDSERRMLEDVFEKNIPGDFLEAGTWRGGSSIFARALQLKHEQSSRSTYVCDSFSGLPNASTSEDVDWPSNFLSVSEDEVRSNFEQCQVYDNNVKFVKGYFQDSLPVLREEFQQAGKQLAVVRGDGDMFESYYDILYNLYEFVPVGGYFICDDCPGIPEAQKAIETFREAHGISEPLVEIQDSAFGSYWRKARNVTVNYTFYTEWNLTRNSA